LLTKEKPCLPGLTCFHSFTVFNNAPYIKFLSNLMWQVIEFIIHY